MPAWTLMVYMAGDNNLSPAAVEDLAELRAIGSSADVRVVSQVDYAGETSSQRMRIERDGTGEQVVELGKVDSGEPQTVLDFVRWAVAHEPADRLALVLWNHGGGWAPSEIERLAGAAPGFTAGEARERAASRLGRLFFRSSWRRVLQKSPRERAICSDDGSGHSLDTVELGRLLAQVHAEIGRPVDLLGMDACLMSSLEVAWEVREHVRCIVGSENEEPAGGWPYERVLAALERQPAMEAAALASAVVGAYVDSYAGSDETVMQSALDTARLDPLLAPLDALAEALSATIGERTAEIWQAQIRSARFYGDTLWDLADFVTTLGQLTGEHAVAAAAADVVAALRPGAGPILAEQHRGRGVARCGGLSVYLPALADLSPFYDELAFARDHRWLSFLRAYKGAIRPAAPVRPAGPPRPAPPVA